MPFTPFHFGLGAAIKTIIPKHFNFTLFCFAQVVTDCETAYYMIERMYPCHRFLHTYVGATLVAIFSFLVGRSLCQFILRLWLNWPAAPFKCFYPNSTIIPMKNAVYAAFIGAYSHVFLDSIMHGDMMPFLPFSPANPLCRIVSLPTLHFSYILLGILGAFYIVRSNRKASLYNATNNRSVI